MFGYVRYDLPNLFVKDVMLYKSLYCGLCKGIGASCGQAARMGLSYDVTFLSALLHNIAGQDIVIERSHCFEHCIRKRPIAAADDMTRALGALNTILVYYKLTDDVLDSGKGRSRRAWFRRGYRRAKKRYPELDAIVGGYIKKQAETERANTASPDAAADPSALMMQEIGDWFLKDKASEFTKGLFYGLGKWVYLIDALDDYEKDGKKKAVQSLRSELRRRDTAGTYAKVRRGNLLFVRFALLFPAREPCRNSLPLRQGFDG